MIKRVSPLLFLLGAASTGFAQTSYDAIDGYPGTVMPLSYYGIEADDTNLVNLHPVTSVDVQMADYLDTTLTNYDVTLHIYATDPITGLPSTELQTITKSLTAIRNDTPLITFTLASPWTPTSPHLFTAVTQSGGLGLGYGLTNTGPQIGTSTADFAVYEGGEWLTTHFGNGPYNFMIRYNTLATPEPAPMLALGLGVLGLITRRRKK